MTDDTTRAGPRATRRGLLAGLASGAAFAACPFGHRAAASPAPDAATPDTPALQRQALYGARQPGIVTERPAFGLVAAFDVTARDLDDLEQLMRVLAQRAGFLMQGGEAATDDPAYPPPDSGILGPFIAPDNLTITVALGDSLFDGRFGLAPLKPRRLKRMGRFPNDALEASLCHGDLLIQVCANSGDTALHALRDLLKNTPDLMVLRWKQEGSVPVRPARSAARPESARNALGFRDGTANPSPADGALMDRLVWVGAGPDEPDWTVDGSYMAVRIIRNFVERWDRAPLAEQEQIIGRHKGSGAPLGGAEEYEEPEFASDPAGERTPLDAHIRLANPRSAQTQDSRILRRPFNYSNGVTRAGQLDMGLLFICFQQDLERGFIAVQRRLDGEPLEEYVKPVGGGYFFALPGLRDAQDFDGSRLLAAARSRAVSAAR